MPERGDNVLDALRIPADSTTGRRLLGEYQGELLKQRKELEKVYRAAFRRPVDSKLAEAEANARRDVEARRTAVKDAEAEHLKRHIALMQANNDRENQLALIGNKLRETASPRIARVLDQVRARLQHLLDHGVRIEVPVLRSRQPDDRLQLKSNYGEVMAITEYARGAIAQLEQLHLEALTDQELDERLRALCTPLEIEPAA